MALAVVNTSCQTLYRESETQTRPWTPPYHFLSANTPEILTLTTLTWGNGLPAGKNEVELVEKQRKKRYWENFIKNIGSPNSLELRTKIIAELEMDSWLFREKEIDDINNERMELALSVLNEQKDYFANRMIVKLKRRKSVTKSELKVKLKQVKTQEEKELRRIQIKENKYRKCFEDRKYITKPILSYERKAGSIILCPEAKAPLQYNPTKTPSRLHLFNRFKPKIAVQKHDCINTQPLSWQEDELMTQKQNLKKLFGLENLNTHHPAEQDEEQDEECDNIERTQDDKLYLATVLIQQTMKGRAIQLVMEENRMKHQGLIDEMLYSISLIPSDIKKKNDEKMAIMKAFRTYCKQKEKLERIIGTLVELEGQTLGKLIDFTAKELVRMSEGDRLAAMCLLGQSERWRREATEAGRRSKERNRERQIREIYRKIVQRVDDDLSIPMRVTLKEAMLSTGILEAEDELRKVVCKIDENSQRSIDYLEREEMICKLNNHILLPELEKIEARRALLIQQEEQRLIAEQEMESMGESTEHRKLSMDEIRTKAEELCLQMISTAEDLYTLVVKSQIQEDNENANDNFSILLEDEITPTPFPKKKKVYTRIPRDDPMSKVIYDSVSDGCQEACSIEGESDIASLSLEMDVLNKQCNQIIES